MEREVVFIPVIGKPGTGKTTAALKFVEKLGKKRCLIIDPDGQEDKWSRFPLIDVMDAEAVANINGVCRGMIPSSKSKDINKMFSIIRNNFRDGLLVLDDCKTYVSNAVDEELRNVFRRKRQMMIDVVTITHGFTDTPPIFFTFATHIVLFSTLDNIERRKNVLPAFEKFSLLKEEIDKKAADTRNPNNKYTHKLIDVNKFQTQ